MIRVRSLTEEGVDCFSQYIQGLRGDPSLHCPDLNTEQYSEEFHSIEIDEKAKFSSRLELGRYLYKLFSREKIPRGDIVGNKKLWTWLTYIWFDGLCPDKEKVRGYERYVYDPDYRHYYRHLVAETYHIYESYGEEKSKLFLECRPYEHGDFIEQMASKQEFISNKNLIEAAHELYWDSHANRLKPGSTDRKRPGNVRRLIMVMDQLKLTYDLHSMSAKELLKLLPTEFEHWKSK